ncbi:MerR family transcriptional regulator [uncultured Slackia sp.]|uniref:MerR family transcriptional regulator n=1 Tax=uncultured Slackia sp. TaxID=665903 RepID=UPI0025D1A0E0|nr:MerR family transcriptional regulator [uncultured Slackia sp.]
MDEQGTRGLMTVGELASRVGVTVRTIQYYDQRGLLHPTCKGEQNLRLYSSADKERLNRIITLKYLGFSLSQIQEGEGSDSLAELTDALAQREAELERESAKILRDMNVVQGLRARLTGHDHANWSELAATVGAAQDREDMLWSAIAGDALEECPIPELSREEVICWHQLMGDTIEAMHDGVLITDDRAQALAIRFSSLGGMPHALAGLKRLARQRSSGPKQYGRDFYAGIQRRTLSFLQDALDCSRANANTKA